MARTEPAQPHSVITAARDHDHKLVSDMLAVVVLMGLKGCGPVHPGLAAALVAAGTG